jgi:hypothetical protein
MKKKNSNRIWGIKSLVINNLRIYTICVRVNSNSITHNRVINDPFWKTRHTLGMHNSTSKLEFMHTTTNFDEAVEAINSLTKILFAHKIAKSLLSEYALQNNVKNEIVRDVVFEMNKIHQTETELPFNDYIF